MVVLSVHYCVFARFVLATEALDEGVSTELVCCDLKLERSE